MSEDVLLFFSGTWRAEERGKRHGIVGRMEKLGRRRNPEVIRVPSHHNYGGLKGAAGPSEKSQTPPRPSGTNLKRRFF